MTFYVKKYGEDTYDDFEDAWPAIRPILADPTTRSLLMYKDCGRGHPIMLAILTGPELPKMNDVPVRAIIRPLTPECSACGAELDRLLGLIKAQWLWFPVVIAQALEVDR